MFEQKSVLSSSSEISRQKSRLFMGAAKMSNNDGDASANSKSKLCKFYYHSQSHLSFTYNYTNINAHHTLDLPRNIFFSVWYLNNSCIQLFFHLTMSKSHWENVQKYFFFFLILLFYYYYYYFLFFFGRIKRKEIKILPTPWKAPSNINRAEHNNV